MKPDVESCLIFQGTNCILIQLLWC